MHATDRTHIRSTQHAVRLRWAAINAWVRTGTITGGGGRQYQIGAKQERERIGHDMTPRANLNAAAKQLGRSRVLLRHTVHTTPRQARRASSCGCKVRLNWQVGKFYAYRPTCQQEVCEVLLELDQVVGVLACERKHPENTSFKQHHQVEQCSQHFTTFAWKSTPGKQKCRMNREWEWGQADSNVVRMGPGRLQYGSHGMRYMARRWACARG